MLVRLSQTREYLRESLWFIPTVSVLSAALLSQVVPWLDRGYSRPFTNFFEFGGADGARLMLSTVAASVLSMTVLVFTLTMLVLQLAANQLSPRVMRMFLRDRQNQLVLAMFIGTYVYSLLALQRVRGETDGGVPVATTWLGLAFGLLSVAAFVYYIHHMAQSIRASTVIGHVGAETRASIERLYPESFATEPERSIAPPDREPDQLVQWPHEAGVVTRLDPDRLLEIAERCDVVIALIPMVGDFIGHDATIMQVWGELSEGDTQALVSALSVARERTLHQDASFGFRQLVDIAERALSPGINDPSTAVQVVDQLHDLLRRLAPRAIPGAQRVDDAGRLRLILPRPDWADYVALAVDEIRLYGMSSLQVVRRLRYLLEDVRSIAPIARHPPLARQLALLDAGLRVGFELDADRETAGTAGRQGH